MFLNLFLRWRLLRFSASFTFSFAVFVEVLFRGRLAYLLGGLHLRGPAPTRETLPGGVRFREVSSSSGVHLRGPAPTG